MIKSFEDFLYEGTLMPSTKIGSRYPTISDIQSACQKMGIDLTIKYTDKSISVNGTIFKFPKLDRFGEKDISKLYFHHVTMDNKIEDLLRTIVGVDKWKQVSEDFTLILNDIKALGELRLYSGMLNWSPTTPGQLDRYMETINTYVANFENVKAKYPNYEQVMQEYEVIRWLFDHSMNQFIRKEKELAQEKLGDSVVEN